MDEVEKYFNDLLNSDNGTRIKAANYFSWLARKEYNLYSKNVFENKNCYNKLFPSLNDESEKVVCAIIQTLGCAYERYKKDQKIETELMKLFNSKNNEIKYTVSIWTKHLDNSIKYNYVFDLLEKAKSQKLISALCGHFGIKTENDIKNKAQKILLNKLETITNEHSIRIIISTIIGIRNEENILVLKKYLEGKDKNFKNIVKGRIEIHLSDQEKTKLLKELNIK
jgi:hypothetical protein